MSLTVNHKKYILWINNLQSYLQYAQREFNGSANKALDPCTGYKVSKCSQHTLPSNNHQKDNFTGQEVQETKSENPK